MTANAPFSFDTSLLESINRSFFDSIAYQEIFAEREVTLKETQLFPLTKWLFKDGSEIGKLSIPQKVLGLRSAILRPMR